MARLRFLWFFWSGGGEGREKEKKKEKKGNQNQVQQEERRIGHTLGYVFEMNTTGNAVG
jgi:hypothetical protein